MDGTQAMDKKWTHERKLLLITTRLRFESDFTANKKKRTTLWEQVLRAILEVDEKFPFNKDEISRCFLNNMVTFKRIKKRNNTSGEGATNWEYFDLFDEVYGSRSSVNVPNEIIEQSLEHLINNLTEDSPSSRDNSVSRTSTPVSTGCKRKRDEVLSFLRTEAEKDEATMEKLLKSENEKIKLEQEKIEELRKIREIFQEILRNQMNK